MICLLERQTVEFYRQTSAITLIALVLLLAPVSSSCSHTTAGKPSTERLRAAQVKVKVFPVERQEQRRTVEAVGSLFAYDEVVVSSEVEGRVEEVMADVGDRVAKGQVLARIAP